MRVPCGLDSVRIRRTSCAQIPRAQVFLAYLNAFHAFPHRAFHKLEQGLGTAGGMPVRNVIAQHQAGS